MFTKKTRIGYTHRYVESLRIEDTEIQKQFIKEGVNCSFCKEKIKEDNFMTIVHRPDLDKPERLHFFCCDEKCVVKWNEQSFQKRRDG